MFPSGSINLRSAAAYRFDRNCVLAATAGQIAACLDLDVEIAAIKVGVSLYDVGIVARDIRLADTKIGPKAAIIASAGSIAFTMAVGLPVELLCKDVDPRMQATLAIADTLIARWVTDWRLAALVKRLDRYSIPGERTDLKWLTAFRNFQPASENSSMT